MYDGTTNLLWRCRERGICWPPFEGLVEVSRKIRLNAICLLTFQDFGTWCEVG